MALFLTAIFHIFAIQYLIQLVKARDLQLQEAITGKLVLVWLVYCVPIHLLGIMPLMLADKMVDMAAYPDQWFGAYPIYCQVDTRYCDMNFFIMIMQGFAGFVLAPLCAIAAYGLWKRRAWSTLLIIGICLTQAYTTTTFFAEPYLHEVNPIVSEKTGLYLFGYWYMNGLWIIVPLIILWQYIKQEKCRV